MQKLNHESVEEFDHTKKKKKKLNHTQKVALALLCILSIAFIQQCRANPPPPYPKITNFTVDPTTADVGEPVNITWTFIGFFDIAVISYGDGNQTQMTMVQENKTYTILHEYECEGKYNVSIYVANTVTTDEDWDAQFIMIQNDPPVFDISIDPSQADEDEFVNVSVTNLQESDHDKKPGLLTYVFDFADGNQTTSNSSSILHKWENGGTYPITVTVIDDQNALNQKTQDIVIENKAPEPDFTIGCEIPSTYGFYSDLIGAFPFGWTSIDKHYEGSYSFVGEVGKNGTDISFLDSTNYGDKFVVIDEFNDHKEVLRCESYGYNAQHFECGVAEGTIEYWFAGWTEKRTLQYLRTDGGDAIQFRTNDLGESDFFQYYNGSDWVSVANASDYDWFHIRFDFDCVTDIYHIYVNEELVASDIDFLNNGTEIDNFYIEPDEWTGGTYYSYFDAFGFSWDPNYNVGDNLYAHESFDAFRVAEGADYHQKILEAKWTEFHDVEIYNTYEPQPNGTVEFWFMTSDTTVDQLCGFSFYDDQGLENFKIFIQNSKWYYSTPAVYQIPNVNYPKNNTWHHVRIDFLAEGQYLDLNPSTFKVTIDGIESGLLNMNYNEDHYPQSMHMKVDKEVGYDGAKSRIDAIGYSWDPHYEIGYNHKIFIKEYYATFDFSEEIIGTEPSENDWYIPPPPSSKDGSFSIIDAGDFGLSDPGETGGDIDESDPNDEVVEIFDNSTSISLIMEHNYTNQAYGSVELWIRSNNTHEKVWVFCLMQNDVLGLALLMDNDEWQYTINDVNYEIIDGNIDPPENDTWYHVRIDFRCTGADPYFSLQEGHFTVSINTVLSSQYQMTPSLTSINRTRVTTGGSDTGTAYIDAIGYSWDPYYQIGDNRFPMVHYPEKSLIWFSASQTTDTSNDEDSLSYYWDFGDGSSDFGKYIAHKYPTSGMYPVELTVMDDNGAKSSKTRIVLISNKYPDINFSSFKDEITTFEGTTIIFDTIVDDENPDVARMEYYWYLNGSDFNPNYVTQYTQGGWINSYTFVDDHDGTLYAMARDPEGAFDFDALNVTVENVDPSVSIRTMDMIANVTFEVERSTGPPWYDNNFTFVLQSTDKFDLEVPYYFTELNFTGSTETTVNHMQENMMFDLLKDWNVYANTTSQISGSVKYRLTFEFKDGTQEVINSDWISSGYAYWEASLDSLWYDETNFTIVHPVEVGISVWDPSTDDVFLDLNYTVDMVVEIQCTDTLPISTSFNISDTYFYDVEVFESNGKKYANITAYTQVADSDEIINEGFPLDEHMTYTLGLIEIEGGGSGEGEGLHQMPDQWDNFTISPALHSKTPGNLEFDDSNEAYIRASDPFVVALTVEVMWSPNQSVYSMNNLQYAYRFDHGSSQFQIYNWDTLGYEDISLAASASGSFTLTSQYYDENYNIKVKFSGFDIYLLPPGANSIDGLHAADLGAYVDLYIDQLRIDYNTTGGVGGGSSVYEQLIDLTKLLVNHQDGPQLNGFSVVECVSALNMLDTYAEDDDGGSYSVDVSFNTHDNIDIQALCPDIDMINNDGGMMTQNISFYLDYYYRSYFRDGSDVTFEQVLTYQDSDQETSFNLFGDPISFAGSGGDSGYVTTNQSTDSGVDMGSAYNELNSIDCSGTDGGSGYRSREQDTISGEGDPQHPVNLGSYVTSSQQVYTDNTDRSKTSSKDTNENHYPGNPGESFRGQPVGSNPDNWVTVEDDAGSWIGISTGTLYGHRDTCELYYDGGGTLYMYRNWGSDYEETQVQFWLYYHGADAYVRFENDPTWSCGIQFQQNGVYRRYKSGLAWYWGLVYSGCTDDNWYNVGFELRTSDTYCVTIGDTNGNQIWSGVFDIQSGYATAWDRIEIWAYDTAGYIFIDGYGETHDSGYSYGQNVFPYQQCTLSSFSVPMQGMHVDNYARRTGTYYLEYRVKVNYAGAGCESPDIYLYIDGQYISAGTIADPSDNVWYTKQIAIQNTQFSGDYDVDLYFKALTEDINAKTQGYTLYVDWVKTKWQYQYYTGTDAYYREPGLDIAAGTLDRSVSVCNNFQRDYGSFTYNIQFSLSQTKQYYVQLYKFIDASPGWKTIYSGTSSGSKSWTNVPLSSDYVEDNEDPQVKLRIYTTGGGNPFNLLLTEFQIHYQYSYTYYYRHTFDLNNMNEFRYRALDMVRGIDMDFDYYFPLEDRDGDIKHKQQNTAAQWQQVGLYDNVGDDLFDYTFLNKDFILYDGSFYVYHEQEIVDHDPDGHATECELDSMSHYYEWDYSYCDIFSLELSDMNDFRYDHFTSCDINYEVKTHNSENLNIRVYNHATYEWDTLNSFTTNGADPDQPLVGTDGFVNFVSDDYILYEASSGKYFVNVSFTGFANPSEIIFDIVTLEAEWDYSYIWDDQFEISLTNMNDFRYDNFEQCTLSYMINASSGEPVDIHLWDYTINDWVYQETVNAGPSYSDSITLTGTSNSKYINSSTYEMKVWFELAEFNPPTQYANSEFDLESMSVSWEYNFTYYDTYQSQLAEMTQFRYDTFTECIVSYNIDLIRDGKSTDVYLYNFTKSDWDFFKTTSPPQGGAGIEDYFTFYGTDYIDSGTYNVRIKFTGFTDTEFALNSIGYIFEWEYDVQDKFITNYDMDDHMYSTYESCTITFSITTSESQSNVQVKMYNYSSSQFVAVGSPFSTTSDVEYEGSVQFTSDEFIHSTEYTTRVYFGGIQDSYLTLNWMKTNYSWSHFYCYCDFGHDNQGMEGISYADMTAIYRNVYNASEVFDYAGTYLITWTVSDGVYETTLGQMIEITYPLPSVAIGDLPDCIIEDQLISIETNIDLAEGFSYLPPEQVFAHLTDFTYPQQQEFDITAGTWNTFPEDSLEFNDDEYAIISADPVSDYVSPTSGDFNVISGDLTYGDLDDIDGIKSTITPDAGVAGVPALEGWDYVRNITLNPSTPENNYQVKVQLSISNFDYSRVKSDGADLRFYTTDETLLNYWIESWNTTGDSLIWVKAPDSGTSVIHMYYGNSVATAMSNGTATFSFFDDFEGTSLDTNVWNEHKITRSGTFSVTVEDSMVKLLMNFGGTEMRGPWTTVGYSDFYTTGGGYGTFCPNGINALTLHTYTHEDSVAQVTADVRGSEWTWLVDDIYYLSDSLVKFYENETLISTHNESIPDAESIPIKFMCRGWDYPSGCHYMNAIRTNNNLNEMGTALRVLSRMEWDLGSDNNEIKIWVDWVFIHEINGTEPVASIGSELVAEYSVNAEVEWSVSDPDLLSIEALRFNHVGPANMDFYIWNYTLGDWVDITSETSPYALTTDLYNSSKTVKVLYNATSSSSFDIDIDQLRIDYTKSSFYKVDTSVEWSISDPELYSMDAIHFDHTAPISIDFYIWNYTLGDWLDITSETSLYTLTADLYNTSTNMVKVRYISGNSVSPFDLQIDQLRIDYTKEIARISRKDIYQYYWDFGDGYFSVDRNPEHQYGYDGNYTATLCVRDLYGNCYNDTVTIEVHEKYPEIIGPYGFSGIEGQAIVLDVAVSDSIFDRKDLTFTWYDENDQEITEFANNQKPIVILNNGVYNYSLEVEDMNGYKDSADILITVNDIPPSVFIQNYIYHGDANSGSLTLTAYAFDYCEDINTLEFTWRISHNQTVDNRGPFSNVNRSSITFDAIKTAIYQGEVSVRDPNTNITNKHVFYICSVIDSNGNGFSDEFEQELADNGENIYDYFDTDKDGISDLYEITHNETDYLDPDTDRDGLYDGVDRLTGMGERPAGTNPIDYDSDDDLLSDGKEVYGWEISTDLEDGIHVSSDPWLNDTDSDGWTDYEEYLYGTHPRNADTDLDGVNDPQDPYPLNADKDEDGLLDSEELAVGTDCGNSDTDEDTLTDGEEVRSGITDPLSADTDRDFVSDSAEVIIKENSIQNRLSLDQPVILQFNHYFQHASAAQISFVLAFGEFDDTVNYGIEDVPDLNVRVSKMDNNLVLYEGNTNGDRYFSHAIDIREVIEDKGYNYYGDYVITVDKAAVGCMLEQFDIYVVGHLDPRDADSDDDGIMDGIEMDTLTRGISIINFTSYYARNNIMVNNISPPDYNFNIEVGSVQLSNTIDQSVVASITFQNEFWFPVVVAYINSRNEDGSVEVRIDNVTSSGCDIFMEEPSNGGHASETINYIVVEYGEWEFPDGTDIKAGILATDQAHQGGSSYSNWEQVNFDRIFYADPIILHSLNTYNNEDFKTSIVSEITTSSFNVTQESAETGTSTDEETIGWIAIESGKTGTINNVKYETLRGNDGDSDGVSPGENGHVFSFQQSFTNIPDVVVVKQLSVNENDGSWARSDGILTAASHRTCAEEDQVGDPERNHADEYFGLVAFEDDFSYGYNYVPPEESEGSSYVKSVEHVELTLTGASGSAQLSKNQNITNCVPFITMKQSVGDDWDDIMCDVYFTDSPATVVAERATTGASITLSIYVVEFDGTNVEVQSGVFSATGTYDEQTIDQIDTSKAVPMAYYKVAGGDDDWDSSMVTTDFASDTTIRMERHQSSGTMSGHYYVFESQNSEFSVQKAELSLTSSDGYDTATISWVNMSKSFIISSYECDRATDDPEDAAVDVWLSSETEVRAERHPELSYSNGAPTINVFVVTFGGDDESVQHGDFTWANTDSFKETDIMDINLEYSMVKSGQMYGIIQCDGTGSADVKAAIVEHKFVDNNTIRLERYTNSEDGKGHWEVVEFFGVPEGEVEEPEEEPEPFDTQYFSLEIPDWGTVYDANLTVTVKSDDTPLGYGTVNITLFKEDINCNIDDVVLIDYGIEFNEIDVYFNQFIDLTDLVNDKTIHQFYGSYRLEIVIFDSGYDDVFNVTQFIIETDTYIQASDDDQNVWITDPSTPDTDGDTVSDYAEIYGWTRGSDIFYTNPLSADSDGDGAKDNIDRHPTENVMIKISPLSATHRSQAYWEASPKLEIAVSYELNGDDDKRYKIFTPAIRATEDLWSKVILFIRYSHYRRTNFAENDIHYYVDVDDNPNVQPENMDFGFSLWHMDVVDFFDIPLWDTWLAGESVVYSIGDVGHSTTFDIYDTGIWGQDNELHVKVETISVEKSNTIAIYNNETMFNGHYKEKEKMNVIVLEVTGNVAGTPFVQGPNAIVIPTELFVETKLNSYLERDKLDETPLYSAVEGEYEFISVGRNGTTGEGCDEVDFVIIRFNINVNDAMMVLSMLLTVIVNDTTGEEVELYEYQSTKEDGADAVLMNLYKEVLGYIPWFCNFENSDQGDEPDDFFEFWAEVFVGTVMAVVYFVYMIGMAIAELFMAFVKFIVAVMMEVLTFLGPLLWLIIRAVLLILAFILLALHLVAQIPVYLMMGLSMLLITALMGGYCEFSWNFVEFSLDNKKVFRMQSDIVWVYWDYFDMNFPWVDDKIIIDGEVIMSSKESILGIESETETEISSTNMFSEITQTPPSLHCGYNLTSGSTYNFFTTYQDFENNAPDQSYRVKLHLINPDGTALSPYQMSIHPDYVGDTDYTDGVLYNYTIDLDTIYQGQGLWHYYFTTKDNSSAHDVQFTPNAGYMLGPRIYLCQYILSEYVSTNYPDEYSRPSGFKNDNFTFVSTWWSEIVPDNVYMCLVPATITTGTGVSKTAGIQKFVMSPVDQNPDYSDFVDYYCTINFTELGYDDDEIGRFNHYYEAIYDNGNKTYLYDCDVESEDYFDVTYCDFRNPYVGATEAQLLDYHFDGANFLSSGLLNLARRDSTLTGNWILLSEMQLRFEVIFMDPSGNPPLENYPQLIFTNIASGEELAPYVMGEQISSQFSTEYGFEVSSYSCVIDVFELPPGVWEFKFEAKDSEELPVDTLYGSEKLWVWGSAMEIMNGFSLTTLTSGTIPLIGYITALPLSKGGTYASIAAAIIAIAGTGYAIYQLGTTWSDFVQSKNAGALLGLCLGTFFACLATSNAFASSFGKITQYIGNILLYLLLVESMVSLLTIPLQFFDVPWGDTASIVLNLAYLPIEFFLLIGVSIAGNMAMQAFGKKTTGANKAVKACMKLMLMFQALISMVSLFSWITITEGWYLF